jgi:hypothetical protein
MINYQGKLLENGDPRYGDDDYDGNQDGETGLFDYYWFRMSQDGSHTYNLYKDFKNEVQMQEVLDDTTLLKSSRIINIKAQHIDDLNMFQCIVVDKETENKTYNLKRLEGTLPTEEEVTTASLSESDPDSIIGLAYDLKNRNK